MLKYIKRLWVSKEPVETTPHRCIQQPIIAYFDAGERGILQRGSYPNYVRDILNGSAFVDHSENRSDIYVLYRRHHLALPSEPLPLDERGRYALEQLCVRELKKGEGKKNRVL